MARTRPKRDRSTRVYEYQHRPEVKERTKMYMQAYMKAYYQRPEPRRKRLAYIREYNKAYLDRPGVREREYARHREWLRQRRRRMRLETPPKPHWSKLSEENVRSIRAKYPSQSMRQLAKRCGVAPLTILNIIRRRTWKHVS